MMTFVLDLYKSMCISWYICVCVCVCGMPMISGTPFWYYVDMFKVFCSVVSTTVPSLRTSCPHP